jgi:multidrug efflux pump
MSKFTDIFIKRPVLATVVSLFILIFGVRAWYSMPLREYPKMENTVVTITTAYPGASAKLIQGFITTPLEKAVAGADGVDYFTSQSNDNVSSIKAYVRLNFDPDKAFTNIMSKVQQVKGQLPKESGDPVIVKKTGSNVSLMYMSFSSPVMSPEQVTAYISQVVQPKLETVPGVADVQILGGSNYAMRIWLRPRKMAALGITSADVSAALQQNNFQTAAGKIKGKYIQVSVNASTDLQSQAQFAKMIVKNDPKAGVVRLRDVARVQLGSDDYDSSVSFNNKKAVFISIDPTPTANPLTVMASVKAMLPKLARSYPPSLQAAVVYDATKYIKASLYEVIKTIIEAALIVIAIIFLFLGSLRTVLIPVITIPLSLIGVFGIMLTLGYSINLLTLLALVLAIGLVVDDAIVVVENTYRHIEEGMLPFEAALKGAREIAMPIIAMTITLAAVYAPIGFMGGITGSLFTEFAFTLAGAVIISGILALTLSPMMCSKLLKPELSEGKFVKTVDRIFSALKAAYQSMLDSVLNKPKAVAVFAVIVLVSATFFYINAPKQLAPQEDHGAVLTIISGPEYANLDYMQKYTDELGRIYSTFPSLSDQFIINGMGSSNSGIAMMMLKPWDQRSKTEAQVYKSLAPDLKKIAGIQAFPVRLPPLPTSGGGLPIQLVLTSTGSYQELYQVMQKIVQKAQNSGMFIIASGSLKFNKPIININIDRSLASALGVNMQTVAQNLALSLGGNYINRFTMYNRSYEVIPQLDRQYRTNVQQLDQIYLKSMSNNLVPLSSIATYTHQVAPNSLTRFNQLNSATVSALLVPGQTMGSAIAYLKAQANKALPANVSYDFAGQSRDYVKEGSALIFAFAFSIIIIFLVLAAQFESFSSPLIVMTSVPMAICGALLPLNWGLATINIYTQIGLITLIGLISKHGILMVDFADKLLGKSTISRRDAILQAAGTRLRPVLMTTAAMILGVVPLVLATGAGAVSRFDIGLTIASGMFIGTMFTLLVVPAMYILRARSILTVLLSAALIDLVLYFIFYII